MLAEANRAARAAAIVRTILGDVNPTQLGWTLTHEHLMSRLPSWIDDSDLCLDDEAAALRELGRFRDVGGSALVEMSTVDYGRDAAALVRLADASGVRLIATTGFNTRRFADVWRAGLDEETLTGWMVSEVRNGLLPYAEPTDGAAALANESHTRLRARAGLIKVATGAGGPTDGEHRAMRAAIAAHEATGAPIGTHTERGEWALEQATALRDGGVAGEDVLIGHLDFRPDLSYLREVAATGVFLGFDQFSKLKYLSDEARVRLVVELASEGQLDQVMLSGDLARKSYWPSYGHADAPGLAHIAQSVVPLLRANGFGDDHLRALLHDNPHRWLRFVPRDGEGSDDEESNGERLRNEAVRSERSTST